MEQHKEDRKISEREERSNVMKMDKWYAGLIAFAAGFALSVGTASAQTSGQVNGDAAAMKLVPYYGVGEMMFTAIGIQNLSTGMADETYAANVGDGGNPEVPNNDPTDNITERFLVDVVFYDHTGKAVKNAAGDNVAGTICLKQNGFGSVVIDMGSAAMVSGNGSSMLSVSLPDMSMGYAELTMAAARYKDCGGRQVSADATPDITSNTPGPEQMATWAILQDTGSGFFGTEIPTATIMRASNNDMNLACRADIGDTAGGINGVANTKGTFVTTRCGVIPDEHDKDTLPTATRTAADPLAKVNARFDITEFNESMSSVFVWLDSTSYPDPNNPLDPGTHIAVTVICEDGKKQLAPDGPDGNTDPDLLLVSTKDAVTMIDPANTSLLNGPGMNLGDYTSKCMDMDGMGGRGTLSFSMPNASQGGMVWTHVTQADSHYRMNFLAYSSAADDT